MRYYKVQLENGLFGIVDLKSKWKIMENGVQLYTSLMVGFGFDEERADLMIETFNKRLSRWFTLKDF